MFLTVSIVQAKETIEELTKLSRSVSKRNTAVVTALGYDHSTALLLTDASAAIAAAKSGDSDGSGTLPAATSGHMLDIANFSHSLGVPFDTDRVLRKSLDEPLPTVFESESQEQLMLGDGGGGGSGDDDGDFGVGAALKLFEEGMALLTAATTSADGGQRAQDSTAVARIVADGTSGDDVDMPAAPRSGANGADMEVDGGDGNGACMSTHYKRR